MCASKTYLQSRFLLGLSLLVFPEFYIVQKEMLYGLLVAQASNISTKFFSFLFSVCHWQLSCSSIFAQLKLHLKYNLNGRAAAAAAATYNMLGHGSIKILLLSEIIAIPQEKVHDAVAYACW